jgi:hypothetical protein
MYHKKKLTFALYPSPIIFFQENSYKNFLIALTPRGTSYQFLINIYLRDSFISRISKQLAQGLNDVLDK